MTLGGGQITPRSEVKENRAKGPDPTLSPPYTAGRAYAELRPPGLTTPCWTDGSLAFSGFYRL